MYAVVDTGGKQAKVEKDAVIAVERLKTEVGGTVTLPVLFLADGDRVLATHAELAGVSVTAEVLEHFKGDKQTVFKLRKRKGYKRTKGHRQTLTALRILEITVGEAPVKAAKPSGADEEGQPRTPAKATAPKAKAAAPKAEAAAPKAGPATQKAKTAAPEPAAEATQPVKEAAVVKPAKAAATLAEAAQCEAVKSDGSRCSNKAKEGSKYCGVHAKKSER